MPLLSDGEFIANAYKGNQGIARIYKGDTLVWTPREVRFWQIASSQAFNVPVGINRIRGLIIGGGGVRGSVGSRGQSRSTSTTRKRCTDRYGTRPVPDKVCGTDQVRGSCIEYNQGSCAQYERVRVLVSRGYTYRPVGTPSGGRRCHRGGRYNPVAGNCIVNNTYTYKNGRCLRYNQGTCRRYSTRLVPRYCPQPDERYRICSNCDCTTRTTTTTTPGGAAGAGGYGGHGFHVVFDEAVMERVRIDVMFNTDPQGNQTSVRVRAIGDWDYTAEAGGRGGNGGNGGRGSSRGSSGSAGASVTDDDGVTYAGEAGRSATGNAGGQGGDGASGIRRGAQAGYGIESGTLGSPFSGVTAADGYSLPASPGRYAGFANAGRGAGLNNNTPGVVLLIGTKS